MTRDRQLATVVFPVAFAPRDDADGPVIHVEAGGDHDGTE